MELVEGGNLNNFIKNLSSPIDDELASYIMREILSGLQHIHMKNIIHRDIKPRKKKFIIFEPLFTVENVLISLKKDKIIVKIADFGLSTEFVKNHSKILSNKCGTLLYMAPEFMKEQTYSKVYFF
jgi:phosphorylase kinase gamma subunit